MTFMNPSEGQHTSIVWFRTWIQRFAASNGVGPRVVDHTRNTDGQPIQAVRCRFWMLRLRRWSMHTDCAIQGGLGFRGS
jgi:hypothetical protein